MADVANYVPCLGIIDVQQGMFTFRRPIYQGEEVLARIAGLLERARSADGFVNLVCASDVVLWR